MKAVLGEEYDPRHAARAFGKNGKYKPTNKWQNETNPKGTFNINNPQYHIASNPYPIVVLITGLSTNFPTIPYLLHAHGVARTTFQRMRKRGTANPPKQVPHNKGKRIQEDAVFEKRYNNPVRMFVMSKMKDFKKTEEGMSTIIVCVYSTKVCCRMNGTFFCAVLRLWGVRQWVTCLQTTLNLMVKVTVLDFIDASLFEFV
jgi:hypothetical protein